MISENEILSMYREIAEYSGNFGDPVASTYSFDPWQLVECPDLTDFERRAVYVALLVSLATAIDNSTHSDVLNSKVGRKVCRMLSEHGVAKVPLVTKALEAFCKSEEEFSLALEPIYREWIVPEVAIRSRPG